MFRNLGVHLCFLFFILSGEIFSQIITTIAGNGIGSYAGDNGPAVNASFSEPQGVMLDDTGNIYVVDEDDNVIRKINLSGTINTVIGTGTVGFSGDNGPAKLAKLNSPGGCAIDRKGNIYIADTYNHAIRKVNTAGIISTIAGHGTIGGYGGDSGLATLSYLNFPEMVAIDASGNIYISDAANNRIRKIDTAGIITTVAGTGAAGYAGDNGSAIAAKLSYPTGIVVDTTSGIIYIGDSNNNVVRKIDTAGIITTFAGTGIAGYSGNGGMATAALLNNPQGVTIDTAGTVYVSDGGNNVIRKVDNSRIISVYAGTGVAGFSGDNGPATLAKIYDPPGITVDITGNLYIAEYFNSRVRKVSFCASPLSLSISGTTTICVGDSTTLTVTGALNCVWSANTGNDTTNSVVIKPVVSTTYSVVGSGGECIAADSVLVTVNTCGTSVEIISQKESILYPNPADKIINIYEPLWAACNFEIFNGLGKMIQRGKLQNITTQIDISEMEEGIYFMRILNNLKVIYQAKFVKQ